MRPEEKKEFIQIFNEGFSQLVIPEIQGIDKKIDLLDKKFDRKIGLLDKRIVGLEDKINDLEYKINKKFESLLTAIDRYTKTAEENQLEIKALRIKVERLETFLNQVAKKVGLECKE